MKIIQSFWTKPYLHNVSDGIFNGGWPNERTHAISWAYSLLKLKEFHNDVMLITDDAGNIYIRINMNEWFSLNTLVFELAYCPILLIYFIK